MTEIKVNPKSENASRELGGMFDFQPLPPPTIPHRVQWVNGVPLLPLDMEDWQFFGFESEADFEEAQRKEIEDMEAAAEAAAEAAQAASLEITEDYEPTLKYQVLRRLKHVANSYTRHKEIRQRYKLMEYVKDVLHRFHVLPYNSPIWKCCVVPVGNFVKMEHATFDGMGHAKIEGIAHDHNTWVCPVCSLKIAVKRAGELRTLAYKAKKRDLELYHLTITMGHEEWEHLAPMLKEMDYCRGRFWRNGTIRRIMKQYFKGRRVSVLEIMRGMDDLSNGWHPHLHILLIGEKGIDIEAIEKTMSDAWIDCLESIGRKGREGIALKIKPCEDIEDYLTKIPCEIALGNVTKHGHGVHMSFFQMVNYALGFPALREEIEPLIVEYYQATRYRKQLEWSRGLKDEFEIKEKSDEELCEETGLTLAVLAMTDNRNWRKLSTHANVAETRVYLDKNDGAGLHSFLDGLGVKYWMSESDYMNEVHHEGNYKGLDELGEIIE